MANANVLPDSRLLDSKQGVVVADWKMLDGTVIRMPHQPIFCFNCGAPAGYVPEGVMSFVSYMCMKCAEEHGELAAHWQTKDEDFWAKVGEEMESRFGHVLDQFELAAVTEQGQLGSALEKLERESPYKVWNK